MTNTEGEKAAERAGFLEEWTARNPAPTKAWQRRPCSICGRAGPNDDSKKCRPMGYPSGDYECGVEDGSPEWFGFFHGRSDEGQAWDGEFWQAVAYSEGMTDTRPRDPWDKDVTE